MGCAFTGQQSQRQTVTAPYLNKFPSSAALRRKIQPCLAAPIAWGTGGAGWPP